MTTESTTNDGTNDTPERITSAEALLDAYANGRRDFRDATLYCADLSGANLNWTNLRDADLYGANLTGADLRWANLTGADLTRATLSGANLNWTNLRDADLYGANLAGANLIWADLTGADLTGVDLTGVYLTRAAGLTLAQLQSANTAAIRDDLYAALAYAPTEVPALLATLRAGNIDGSTYNSAKCACLAGTIARLTGDIHNVFDHGDTLACGLRLDAHSPRERLFLAIRPGDTPETHAVTGFVETLLVAWLVDSGAHNNTPTMRAAGDD